MKYYYHQKVIVLTQDIQGIANSKRSPNQMTIEIEFTKILLFLCKFVAKAKNDCRMKKEDSGIKRQQWNHEWIVK